MESFPAIIRRSSSLAMFIGFHSLENKIILEGLNSAVEKENIKRGVSSSKSENHVKNAKILDRGTTPSKSEILENPASKSAEFYSIMFKTPLTTTVREDGIQIFSSAGGKTQPIKGGWSSTNPRSILDKQI